MQDPFVLISGIMCGMLVLILVLLVWCIWALRRHHNMLQAYDSAALLGAFAVNEQALLNLRKDTIDLRDGITTLAQDLENLRSFAEQTHRYSNNRADRVVSDAMGKLNGLYERIDALEGEVITQQITRHKLNEMLASGLKDRTHD